MLNTMEIKKNVIVNHRSTMQGASVEGLQLVSRDCQAALVMAYEMLETIQAGRSYDSADYMMRKAAIAACIDIHAYGPYRKGGE